MRNGKTYSLAAGAMILALLLGNALSGIGVVGYHPECIDGIDNDGDGQSDGMDIQCSDYPYEDGNGESETPPQDRSTSSDDYSSFFEYHRDYMTAPEQTDTICFNIQFQPGGYDADDLGAAQQYVTDNGLNCETGGP